MKDSHFIKNKNARTSEMLFSVWAQLSSLTRFYFVLGDSLGTSFSLDSKGWAPINKCNLFWFLVYGLDYFTVACSHTLHILGVSAPLSGGFWKVPEGWDKF